MHRFGGVESIYDVHHSMVVGKGMRGKSAPLGLAEDGLFFMFFSGATGAVVRRRGSCVRGVWGYKVLRRLALAACVPVFGLDLNHAY